MHESDDERLQRYLSRAKVCSRRQAEKLIEAGKVTVNGTVATLGQRVCAGRDRVCVSGREIIVARQHDYFLLHKPRGYLTTRADDRGRPTVMDLLGQAADTYVYPVGRLDLDSSGLVLLTNDGELAHRLLHPSHEVGKVYRVRLSRKMTAKELRSFTRGMPIDGRQTVTASIRRLTAARCDKWYEVRLREGRKRQIRRMMAALGHTVKQLVRIGMGPLSLRGLVEGRFRRLSDEEVKALRAASSGKNETNRPTRHTRRRS